MTTKTSYSVCYSISIPVCFNKGTKYEKTSYGPYMKYVCGSKEIAETIVNELNNNKREDITDFEREHKAIYFVDISEYDTSD